MNKIFLTLMIYFAASAASLADCPKDKLKDIGIGILSGLDTAIQLGGPIAKNVASRTHIDPRKLLFSVEGVSKCSEEDGECICYLPLLRLRVPDESSSTKR